jgi:hypothetical protein
MPRFFMNFTAMATSGSLLLMDTLAQVLILNYLVPSWRSVGGEFFVLITAEAGEQNARVNFLSMT